MLIKKSRITQFSEFLAADFITVLQVKLEWGFPPCFIITRW